MGKVIIQSDTTKNPIQLIGKEAGICWGAKTTDKEKNYKRGLDCIKANHGRTLEFPQVYATISGYSAKTIRELYTHIAGGPTRLQASTRYIGYDNFKVVRIPLIDANKKAEKIYNDTIEYIRNSLKQLKENGVPNEDATMILPLCMETKMVLRTNLRQLIDMSHQRECNRAYWEFRELFNDLKTALSNYDEEWKFIVDNYFMPKCKYLGFCPENDSCRK